MHTSKYILDTWGIRSEKYGDKFIIPGRIHELLLVTTNSSYERAACIFERERKYIYSYFIFGTYILPFKNGFRIKIKISARFNHAFSYGRDEKTVSFLGRSSYGYFFTKSSWKDSRGIQIWFLLLLKDGEDPFVFLGNLIDIKDILTEEDIIC